MKLAVVIPKDPESGCGVADYAGRLRQSLFELNPSLRTTILWPAVDDASGDWQIGDRARGIRFGQSILSAIEGMPGPTIDLPQAVLLQYSGYGFSRNGAPAWLIATLDYLREKRKHLQLLTYFHEVYATSPPWRRAFYYTRQQKRVAAEVAMRSDAILTNRLKSGRWLDQFRDERSEQCYVLAVPSNVGEPKSWPCWQHRRDELVLFGGSRFKQVFLAGRYSSKVVAIAKQLSVDKIINIGSRVPEFARCFGIAGLNVEQTGYLNAMEVSKILARTKFGLFEYFPDFLTKSGVLAAYAAHGVVPVCRRRVWNALKGEIDYLGGGAILGFHAMRTLSQLEKSGEFAQLSRRLFSWYESHCLRRHALCIDELLEQRARHSAVPS